MREFLDKSIHKRVTVITSVGLFHGKLVNYDISFHGDLGPLVLDSQQGPVLILRWIAIGSDVKMNECLSISNMFVVISEDGKNG